MYAQIVDGLVANISTNKEELLYGSLTQVEEVHDWDVQVGWLWTPAGCTAPPVPVVNPNAVVQAKIDALEALQTPRLLRESLLKKQAKISDSLSPLNGMTPAEAIAYIDAQVEILRAQLV